MTRNVVARSLLALMGLLMAGTALAAVPAGAASTAGDGAPVSVTINGRSQVNEGETVGDVWILSGQATIQGRVDGSVIVLNGGAAVSGSVGGDIIVVRGGVWVGPEGVVRGDVTASQPITVTDGGTVDGEQNRGSVITGLTTLLTTHRMPLWIALTIALLGVGFLMLRLAGRSIERGRAELAERPFGSAVWGAGLLALLPVLAVVALATMVGGLLGLLLLAATALAAVAGLALSATTIGRRVFKKRSLALAFTFGAVVLRAVALVPVLGEFVTVGAMIVGTGALVLAWRRQRGIPEPAPEASEDAPVPIRSSRTVDLFPDVTPDLAERVGPDDQALGADWLDLVVAGADRQPVVDVRSSDPDLGDGDGEPRVFGRVPGADSPAPVGQSNHEIIASLPVREEPAGDQSIDDAADGAERTAEATQRALLSSDPRPANDNGVPLVAPSAEAQASAAPTPAPTAPVSGPDPQVDMAPDSPLRLLDPDIVSDDAVGESYHEARARLFLETLTAVLDEGDQTVGGLFTTGSRAWRPEHN